MMRVKTALKTSALIIVLAFILALGVLEFTGYSVADGHRDIERTLFVGDSLSLGVGTSSPVFSIPAVVARQVGSNGPGTVSSIAIGGGKASDLDDAVRASAPTSEVTVVEVGTNDVGSTALNSFQAHYRSILTAVTRSSDSAHLVCVGPWGLEKNVMPFEHVIADSCAQAGGTFVQISDLYVVGSLRGPINSSLLNGRSPDYFHPNDNGSSAIAYRISAAIENQSR